MTAPIPKKIKDQLVKDEFMKICLYHDIGCYGRVEFHHPLIYAGRQVQEVNVIVPLCKVHHSSEYLEYARFVALSRMTEEDFNKYPKAKECWLQDLKYLTQKYGKEGKEKI